MAAMLVKLHAENNADVANEERANQDMFKLWEVFYVKCHLENRVDDKDCKEVETFLLNRVNPHTGKSYKGEANFKWLDERFGIKTSKKTEERRLHVKLRPDEKKFKMKKKKTTP